MNKAIEPKRKDRVIGKSLDAQITVYTTEEIRALVESDELDAREFFIVSKIDLKDVAEAPADAFQGEDVENLKITVEPATGDKCERCWRISEDLGTDPEFADACPRCTEVLKKLN